MVALKRIWIAVGLVATGCISKPDKPGGPRVWRQIVGADQPGQLRNPRLTYDPASQSIVMLGGELDPTNGSQSLTNAMYRFDGTQWVKLCDPCLAQAHLMPGFASDGHRFVAFAGVTDVAGNDDSHDVFELIDGKWASLATTGTEPPDRNLGQLVAFRDQLYAVGGYEGGTPSVEHDAYVLAGAAWTSLAVTTASFAGAGQIIAADTDNDRIVAFVDDGDNGMYDELWSFDGAWKQLCQRCTSTERNGASIVHIDGVDLTLILGGVTDSGLTGGTWSYSGNDSAATRYDGDAEQPFPPRSVAGVAYDPEHDIVVVYGGNGCGPNHDDGCAETWELDRVR
jgi:hypothetical protein